MEKNNDNDIRIKHHKRHVIIWHVLIFIFKPGLKLFFRLKSRKFKGNENGDIPESFMVISNHCTSSDPIMIALSFPQHMYFIAGNHVFKSGIWSRLLTWFFAPIGRQKSHSATAAVIESIKCLKQGYNVCMFAEGNCSYNGLTSPISTATGKMIKKAGCGLVTYHFAGDYYTSPRWSVTRRWGPVRGYPVTYLTAADIKKMTVDEINELIAHDLSEDAYKRQDNEHHKYYGRKLAEALETLLYVCPACHGIGTMTSRKDVLSCSCGMQVRYDLYGFMHDESPVSMSEKNTSDYFFSFPLTYKGGITITDWDNYQRRYLFGLIDNTPENEVIFSDEYITLCKSNSASERIPVMTGLLSISDKEIVLENKVSKEKHVFLMDRVIGFSTSGRNGLVFSYDKILYELRAHKKHKNFNALKYSDYYNYIMMKQGRDIYDRTGYADLIPAEQGP